MFNSGMLDVAIGLIFIYLLLSLVCSAINELIEAKLKMRAVDLERGIRELLGNDKSLVKQFYNHPLIFSLFLGSYDPSKVDQQTERYKTRCDLPSYIPSRNFALTLMDLILPANSTPAPPAASATLSGTAGATTSPSSVPPPPQTGVAGNPPLVPKPLQPLRDAISGSQNEYIKCALLPLIDAAGDDVSKARENIEAWYDSTMDRVSGWYKRRAQRFVLVIGFAVAMFVNADTITIGNSLSHDVSMRDSLVSATNEYARVPTVSPPAPPATPSPNKPKNEAIAEACTADKNSPVCLACREDADSPTCTACLKDENSPTCKVARNLSQIRQLGLPIGWDLKDARTFPGTFGGWFNKVIGWLVTAVAISFGAPFWFDLLNKIMVVRSTVKPREKSPEEPPVDRA